MDGSPEDSSSSQSSHSSPSSSGSTNLYNPSFDWPYNSMGLPRIDILNGGGQSIEEKNRQANEGTTLPDFWMYDQRHNVVDDAVVKVTDEKINSHSIPFPATLAQQSAFAPSQLIAQQSSLFSDQPPSISPALTNSSRLPILPIDSDISDDEVDDQSEDTSDIIPQLYPLTNKSLPKPPTPVNGIGGTNLVAKEVVVASSLITSSVSPAPSSLIQSASNSPLQLLILGVPTSGAKSRVETQIKISLVLLRPKHGNARGEEQIASDGGLLNGVGSRVERIKTWSHIKLPRILALRQKNKKQTKPDPLPSETLFLEVALLAGSEPHQEIFICTGCQQREHKRFQRKKEARVRPILETEALVLDAEEEKRKIVVFNCAEYIEFGEGEVILPTRITCYCRHHKEKLGFAMSFLLKDCEGNVVAAGQTPAIMITDDHKTNIPKPPSDKASASKPIAPVKAKTGRPAKKVVATPREDPIESRSTLDRPRRAATRPRAARGVTESDDEDVESMMMPGRNSKKSAAGPSKPYDSDQRPRKRPSGVHRSPSFAMTPLLTMSKPGSPINRPVADSDSALPTLPQLPALDRRGSSIGSTSSRQHQHYHQHQRAGSRRDSLDAALGMTTDYIMRDTPMYASSDAATAPSPAPSFEWSTSSNTPYSPGAINIPHDGTQAFNNFYTPNDTTMMHRNSIEPLPSNIAPALLSRQNSYSSTPYDSNNSIAVTASGSALSSSWAFADRPSPPPPPPRISRLIPGEGPVHGGIEVTVLGENFIRDLTCVFGDSPAMTTHFWSSNTLICILPPSSTPGPVVVGIKGTPLSVEHGLQLFTYKDDSDRSLLELALQVVGLKMTGRLEDAKNVAMRIVGSRESSTPSSSRHVSPIEASGFASVMASATSSVYNTPDSSRRSSIIASERNFESIVINFLSLLDLDPSLIPGSTPCAPFSAAAISHLNPQRHTLLHLATVLGFSRLATFLLARDINVEAVDRNGYTALHFAALYGRVAITRQLLDAGAASYKRTRDGLTPVNIAQKRGDVDVEEVLMRCRSFHGSTSRRGESSSVRESSGRSTPASSYDISEASDWDRSEGEENEDDEDDDDNFSFHSSDEDLDETIDLERGLSRSNSVVSLHYLLHMEDDEVEEEDYDDGEHHSKVESMEDKLIGPNNDSDSELTFTATKAGVWQRLPRLPLTNSAAWAKMKLPAGMSVDYFVRGMPQLVAFPIANLSNLPNLWSNEKDTPAPRETKTEDDSSNKSSLDWRNYIWQSSSPPPMYSPNDPNIVVAINLPPVPSTSSITYPPIPIASSSTSAPSKAVVQAKLQRRVGYIPDTISDRVVQSYLHAEKKRKSLRNDKMLFIFWIPALLLVLAWALYSSSAYIRPVLLATVDYIVPFALH